MAKEKYYRCPNCGAVTTETERVEECGSGGNGMCGCEFHIDRSYYEYREIIYDEYLAEKI